MKRLVFALGYHSVADLFLAEYAEDTISFSRELLENFSARD